MASKYIILVIDDLFSSATEAEMQSIDLFNEVLRKNNQWIFAGGLAVSTKFELIDNRANANISSQTSLVTTPENYSGFWLIQAEDLDSARQIAFAGSKACNRKVELRPLLGK